MSLDLAAISDHAELVYVWVGEDPHGADRLPPIVVQHFTAHVPALIREVQHLHREMESVGRQLLALAGREQGPTRNVLESLAAELLSTVPL